MKGFPYKTTSFSPTKKPRKEMKNSKKISQAGLTGEMASKGYEIIISKSNHEDDLLFIEVENDMYSIEAGAGPVEYLIPTLELALSLLKNEQSDKTKKSTSTKKTKISGRFANIE